MQNRKKVEVSEATKLHIQECMLRFVGMRGYPDNEFGFKARCEALGQIVHDKPNGQYWKNAGQEGKIQFDDTVGPIENDLEWLVEEAMARWSFCPTPRHLRALYCTHFIPVDGVQISVDLDNV